LKTKKSAISRIENHAEDIKLSTSDRFAKAIGNDNRKLTICANPNLTTLSIE